MQQKTSIIILTHNKLEYTQLCIESIRKYTTDIKYEIIVVDNASADGTVKWLQDQTDIISILNNENKGFAGGCNQGIDIATGTEILLLNNDTVVMPKWLVNLHQALYSSNSIGAVGPVTNNASNWQAIETSYQNIEDAINFGTKYNRESNPVKWQEKAKLIGYCMLIKRSVVEKVGLLDEQFFPGNFEDDDYSLRILLAGYKLLQCNNTFIHHFGSVSFKSHSEKFAQVLLDNQNRFFRKWTIPAITLLSDMSVYEQLNIKATMNILEIGGLCGAGLLELKASNPNANFYGIENNALAAQIANKFYPVVCDDIEKMDITFEKFFFDYIILSDTLPIFNDPTKVLNKIKPFLKDNGQIIISCYNSMHYNNIKNLLESKKLVPNRFSAGAFAQNNKHYFTLSVLENIATQAGFNICTKNKLVYEKKDLEENNEVVNNILKTQLVPADREIELRVYRYILVLQKKIIVNDNTINEKDIETKKICFITCVNNDDKYKLCLQSIRKLNVPKNYNIEILPVKNAVSIAQGYNMAMRQSNAKYKVYLHQDVRIINKNFIYDLLHLFSLSKQIGLIGVAGAKKLPETGIWWDAEEGVGCIIHNPSGKMLFKQRFEISRVAGAYDEVEAIDGNLMITQYDLPWREDLFTGWHFYDVSQSMEFIKKGYKVIVPDIVEPWNIHECGINKMNHYESDRKIFLKEYGKLL